MNLEFWYEFGIFPWEIHSNTNVGEGVDRSGGDGGGGV
jgi:hypothetical protein